MYTLMSDLHFHNWSAFATPNRDGINSRLQITIDEFHRAAEVTRENGSTTMVIAGDVFHVRGTTSHSVLNPVIRAFDYEIETAGMTIYAIPGNHDLESKDSKWLTNGIEALDTVGVIIANSITYHETNEGDRILLVPWHETIDALKLELEEWVKENTGILKTDLIIHAPVDGVIYGLPDHGLTPDYLSGLGFKNVFSGHYHNHVDFKNAVYSIGATTHQTWSDTYSKAGFLTVNNCKVKYNASHAPLFYTLDAEDKDDIMLKVDGNYVRVTMETDEAADVNIMRKLLTDSGALGVVCNQVKKSASVSRTGSTTKSGASLLETIGEYIKEGEFPREGELTLLCSNIMTKAGAI